MNNFQRLITNYINDPSDPENNFSLGIYYEDIGQTASAVSYYLRTAERTDDDLLKYECLIRASMCFDSQGCRGFTVRGLLQHAIALLPKRPEAYYLLSRFYEREQKVDTWKECYFVSSIGHSVCEYENNPPLRTKVDYPGDYAILFEKAVSSWWCGLCDESRELFRYLNDNYDLDEVHKKSVEDNLMKLNDTKKNVHEVYLPKKYKNFDWGDTNEEYIRLFSKENFIQRVYEKHFSVQENDIVVDFGANCGSFTCSVLENNPKHVYCVEPSDNLVKALRNNTSGKNVTIIHKAISDHESHLESIPDDDVHVYCHDKETYSTTTFKNIIKDNNISKIDFIKTDCEGGEYFIFTEENAKFIKENVKKIAGEFHICGWWKNAVEKFRIFRDNYLKDIRHSGAFYVYEACGKEVSQRIFDDQYLNEFDEWWTKTNPCLGNFMVYIDYEKAYANTTKSIEIINKKWKNSIAPTLEFTTSIPEKGCVVDCVFCPQRTLERKYTGERFLSLENFKKVIDKLPQEIRVTFAGFTEPWLNKYASDMLLYAYEKGHPISVFTTGIGMSVKDVDMIKHVPYAGNPNGGFTLHLPDNERRAKHPITKRYIEVLERFKEVHHEIQNFTLMCMGTVHDDVKHIFPEAPRYEMWSRAGNLLGESMLKPELLNIKDEYKSIYHGEQPMTCGCLEDLYHNILLPNGDVSLCCMDYNLDHILGNLFEQEYDDIMPELNTCFNLCRFCENAKKPS